MMGISAEHLAKLNSATLELTAKDVIDRLQTTTSESYESYVRDQSNLVKMIITELTRRAQAGESK